MGVADMLTPMPMRMLTNSATLKVCTGVDAWCKPTWQEYNIERVHLQNTNDVKKTKDNTEVVLRSILFIDGTRSFPVLDYDALVQQSEAAGKPLRVVVRDILGSVIGDYEVLTVDPIPDIPATRVHHIELGLV